MYWLMWCFCVREKVRSRDFLLRGEFCVCWTLGGVCWWIFAACREGEGGGEAMACVSRLGGTKFVFEEICCCFRLSLLPSYCVAM